MKFSFDERRWSTNHLIIIVLVVIIGTHAPFYYNAVTIFHKLKEWILEHFGKKKDDA
mgnify:CR=1|tara:strand:- start:301 stop:471 length:171 start_codon:yes stop_codon:yes gene_type:complete